jgi:hypothetical protein
MQTREQVPRRLAVRRAAIYGCARTGGATPPCAGTRNPLGAWGESMERWRNSALRRLSPSLTGRLAAGVRLLSGVPAHFWMLIASLQRRTVAEEFFASIFSTFAIAWHILAPPEMLIRMPEWRADLRPRLSGEVQGGAAGPVVASPRAWWPITKLIIQTSHIPGLKRVQTPLPPSPRVLAWVSVAPRRRGINTRSGESR